eukprot:9544335-Ditylum_brightwellii.AAC.1
MLRQTVVKIWQPYFRKGVNKATTQATTKTRLLTGYFQCKTSALTAHLPRGHQTIDTGMDNDRPIGGLQSTMYQWLKQLQPK